MHLPTEPGPGLVLSHNSVTAGSAPGSLVPEWKQLLLLYNKVLVLLGGVTGTSMVTKHLL